ncbi:MAG TPA: multiheme c-type cytochrome, partial [Bryobacteraceae bacterium]|nr:multiheme c-type cytochrome [Bryobacteraceae bacterium]
MRRAAKYGLALLIVNSAYLAAFAQASIFYEANVLLHLGLGLALAVAAIGWSRRYPRECGAFLASAAVAIYLVFRGNLVEHRWALALHIVLALAALVMIGVRYRVAFAGVACVLAALAAAAVNRPHQRIENPPTAPLSMDEEGAGAKSPFAPSSARTNTGTIIPSNFFMDSEACGQCHKDIYEQWKSSMHHFASFNNQFYRKSIEYMQDVAGTRPSKWCAGCHDHAVFFNGRFDRPIREQIDTPEAQAGLGCMSCHAIVHVGSSMGNADFRVEYPPLHELASSHNRYIRALDHFLTYLNPKPHKRTFLKPFMTEQSAEFCAACHKVHLDVPVNNYRWLRGFNDYDNWQASGVSGQGARSFYYPAKSQTCADCHMPLTPSRDP